MPWEFLSVRTLLFDPLIRPLQFVSPAEYKLQCGICPSRGIHRNSASALPEIESHLISLQVQLHILDSEREGGLPK